MIKRTQSEVLHDLEQWGVKLQRTGNRLSRREVEAFYRLQKEAATIGIKDRFIDRAIRTGRLPKPRYAVEGI